MSNLAPFVAAALRDKSVVDVQKENDALRKDNDRLREMFSVQITGPDGTPVYSDASLVEHGHIQQYDDRGAGWVVDFRKEALRPCLVEDLKAIEVRVGGVVIFEGSSLMEHEYGRVFEDCLFDEETGYCEFEIYNLGSEGFELCNELYLDIGPYESVGEYEKQAVKLGIRNPYTDLPSCRDLESVCNLIFFRRLELDYEKVKLQVKACERQLE